MISTSSTLYQMNILNILYILTKTFMPSNRLDAMWYLGTKSETSE